MKRFAFFAIASGCVVTTVTAEEPVPSLDAPGGMAVAFAASANGEVGRRVEGVVSDGNGCGCGCYGGGVRVVAALRCAAGASARASAAALAAVVTVRVEAVENDADVGGRHPVLQDGTVLKVEGARPALHRAESDARAGQRVQQRVGVGAEGLLLVGLCDDGPVGAAVEFATLRRVILEGLPRLAKVHALVDGQAVRLAAAELQADVSQLVFLAQRQRQRHVAVLRQGRTGRRLMLANRRRR